MVYVVAMKMSNAKLNRYSWKRLSNGSQESWIPINNDSFCRIMDSTFQSLKNYFPAGIIFLLRECSVRNVLAFSISGKEKLILLSLNEDSGCISKEIASILRTKLLGYLLKGLRVFA